VFLERACPVGTVKDMAANTNPNITGADLREARLALGLTQAQVARKAQLSHPNYLSSIERGLQPGARTLARIAKAVGLDSTSGGTVGTPISSRGVAGGSN
jgi:transcriptional regulator with XRE-family HTH domain